MFASEIAGNSAEFSSTKVVFAHLIILKRCSGVHSFVGTDPPQYRLELRQDNFFPY